MLVASKGREKLRVRVYGDSPERVVASTTVMVNCIQPSPNLLEYVCEGEAKEIIIQDKVRYVSRVMCDAPKQMRALMKEISLPLPGGPVQVSPSATSLTVKLPLVIQRVEKY